MNGQTGKQPKVQYERPVAVLLGTASELILGGSKYSHDCCDCKWGS